MMIDYAGRHFWIGPADGGLFLGIPIEITGDQEMAGRLILESQ